MTGAMWGPFDTLSEAEIFALGLNQPSIRQIKKPPENAR
jgi:hypothetical protein